MHFRVVPILLAVASLATLVACNSDPQPTSLGDGAPVNITLRTEPDAPTMGQVDLIVTLTDETGKPIDNAEVSLITSHKEMMGMDMGGQATAQGSGRYTVTADFTMSGPWLVTIEVRGVGAEVVRKDFDLALK